MLRQRGAGPGAANCLLRQSEQGAELGMFLLDAPELWPASSLFFGGSCCPVSR